MTRTTRSRAGWCLALLYLACVLLPGIAMALATDAAQAAPCIEHVMAMPSSHEAGAHHAAAHDQAGHDHMAAQGGTHHHGMVADAAASTDGDNHKSSHHTTPGPCCAMLCLSALPAAPAELAAPVAVTSRCTPAIARSLTDAAPSRRDRPPMA